MSAILPQPNSHSTLRAVTDMPIPASLGGRKFELTDTQAHVIYELVREAGLDFSDTFHPLEFWPFSTREHHECRRACNELASMGLIDLVPAAPCRMVVIGRNGYTYRLRVTRQAVAAYDLWVCKGQKGDA